MRGLTALALAVAVVVAPGAAYADDPASPRPLRWGLGFGGFGALTGPSDYGPAAEVELYPGGSFGRYGVRAEYRGFENFDAGFFTLGVSFEAGAARPKLQLALHADVGLTYSEVKPVVAAGVQWQLWIKPPFGISLDSGGYLIVDGTDTSLALMSAVTLRIAR